MSHTDGSGTPSDDTDDTDETYVTSFEPGDRPSESVVRAIATLTDESPIDLTPLYEAIEPDALDSLFDHARRSDESGRQRLTFAYAGYEVLVCDDGTVEVTPL